MPSSASMVGLDPTNQSFRAFPLAGFAEKAYIAPNLSSLAKF